MIIEFCGCNGILMEESRYWLLFQHHYDTMYYIYNIICKKLNIKVDVFEHNWSPILHIIFKERLNKVRWLSGEFPEFYNKRDLFIFISSINQIYGTTNNFVDLNFYSL